MGFFDTVKIATAHEECGVPQGKVFQTKSLHAACGEFTVTADGKLIEHLYRYDNDMECNEPSTLFPRSKRVPMGDKAIDYHGDLLLRARGADGCDKDVVARFTRGQLEWIRPLSDYPEENRVLLLEQGAR